jgi:formylglycine-generating enzyme required for sulfatase activity
MTKNILGFAAVLFIASAQIATAQTVLRPDVSMSGSIADDDVALSYDGRFQFPFDCYIVEAPVGEAWEIVVTTDKYVSMRLKPGLDCSNNEGYATETIDTPEVNVLTFVSGGGRYYVSVIRGWAINSRARKEQDYNITFRRAAKIPKGAKMIPPGIVPVISAMSPGAASRAAEGGALQAEPGRSLIDCVTCPQMVVVPAGTLTMGSPVAEEGRNKDEGPRHSVTFSAPFAIARSEVTFDQWNACVAAAGCKTRPGDQGWGQGDRPVVDVSWLDAMAYAEWLSQSTGQRYFLPTESEWEYAARAGTDTPWSTGDAIVTDDANMLGAFGRTAPVAGFPPNAFGLYDMHGNVAEWVQDCHDMGYFGTPPTGAAAWKPDCPLRVQRGGSWADEPAQLRSAARKGVAAWSRSPTVGFRVTRAL